MSDCHIFDRIVRKDRLKKYYSSEEKNQLDTRVKYHIYEMINTMYFVYKQNFMRWTLYEKFLQHELYQRMISRFRERGYEVEILTDEKNYKEETDIIGEIIISWNTEEKPEPSIGKLVPLEKLPFRRDINLMN